MAMSISPAQTILQVASAESPAPAGRSAQAAVPAATRAAGSSALSPTSAPVVPSSAQYSTDLRVDDQHQVYYEVVDDRSGDVLFEIPPEALREIGESLHLPLVGESSVHSVDVKS